MVLLAILAILAILPACDLLDRKAENPVGPTNVGDNPSGSNKPGEQPQAVSAKDPMKWPTSVSDFQWPFSSNDYIHWICGASWKITCGYNCSSYHSGNNKYAVDLVRYDHHSWTRGSPVLAPARGVVDFAGWSGCYGWCVILNHDYGHTGLNIKSIVAHLDSDPRRWVNVGNDLRAGTFLGYCGGTGCVTGPHIHFCIWKNGVSQPLSGISGYSNIYEGGVYYSLNTYVRPPANPPW